HTLAELCEQLIAHGKPAETPAAIVSNGTRAEQKVLTGTLDSLSELQSKAQLPAPALIIVGEVVLLHENLAWFGEDVLQNHGLILPDAL
ncbi:MAG: siroheme synthase, partial [Amphritea sp.]|nr:siroheme synthase [Amphritea sp.]